jgi:O-antigen/teichoic acid export membrane protein
LKPFDEKGGFRPSSEGVRTLAVRGAGATLFSGGATVAIQIIATVALARLLSPAQFGVVAMVTTFSMLLVNFGINGFTEAVIQREEVNRQLVSNLFWINFCAGIFLTLAFAASGSLLAHFFHNPMVRPVAWGISTTILISSTSVLHLALLKRAMRFSAVSMNDIIARIVYVVVSMLMALAGWGDWALVGGLIAQQLSTATGAWILCSWLPSWPRRAPGTSSMIKFAVNVYGRFCVNYMSRNTDNLLVGWRFDAMALGFYKKAYDLFSLSAGLLVAPLSVVAVAALSRYKDDQLQFRRLLLNSLSLMAFVGMGMSAALTLIGKDVIRLLLGPGWEVSGRIFTFFGPGIGVMLLYGTHGWIHLSIGKANRWFRWGIIEFVFTSLLFVLALPWGPQGVAVAWTLSFWLLAIPAFWYAGSPIGLKIHPILSVVWKYVLASVLAGGAAEGILHLIHTPSDAPTNLFAFTRIVLVSLGVLVLYLVMVIVLHRGAAPLYQLKRIVYEMIPRAGSSAAGSGLSAAKGEDRDEVLTLTCSGDQS